MARHYDRGGTSTAIPVFRERPQVLRHAAHVDRDADMVEHILGAKLVRQLETYLSDHDLVPGDAGELATSLKRALTERSLVEGLRVAGARRAEDFAMSTLADRYVEIYHDLVAARSRTLAP